MSDYFKKRFYNTYKEEEIAPSIKRMEKLNPDRISNLPDDLIVSILSLLTATEVVQTGILSKRWLNLWALVPSLCFDNRDCNGDINRFKNFFSNFLLKRIGSIDTHSFRILYTGLRPVNSLDDLVFPECGDWIKYAVNHNPKTFELSLARCCRLDIPDCFFTCKTLEDVKLNLQGCLMQEIKPSVVSLCRLRYLDMTEVKFYNDNLEKIIVGCPILENLTMKNCFLGLSSFSCHSVKKLQLVDPEIYSEMISISVPCVQTLLFSWDVDFKITLKNTEKIARAIWLDDLIVFEEEHMYDFLGSLSGVEELDIPSNCVQELLKCPKFHNLKVLTIREVSVCCEFGAWTSFFKRCPHLEELYFVHPGEFCWLYGEDKHENLIQFERCSCKDLKTVRIISDKLQDSMLQLKSLVEEWTKDTNDAQVSSN